MLLISALYTRHAIMIGKLSRNANCCPIICQTMGSQFMTSDLQHIMMFCLREKMQASSKQNSKRIFQWLIGTTFFNTKDISDNLVLCLTT